MHGQVAAATCGSRMILLITNYHKTSIFADKM